MGLNIKSEEVHRLAREVADRMGASMTGAIEAALREKLERLDQEKNVDAILRRVDEIVKRSGPTAPGVTSDHSDLYGDDGLPA